MPNTDDTPTQYRHFACQLCDWSSAAHPDPDGTGETPDLVDEYRKAWLHAETHGGTYAYEMLSSSVEHIGTVVTVRA